jgi:hypothetical protein
VLSSDLVEHASTLPPHPVEDPDGELEVGQRPGQLKGADHQGDGGEGHPAVLAAPNKLRNPSRDSDTGHL